MRRRIARGINALAGALRRLARHLEPPQPAFSGTIIDELTHFEGELSNNSYVIEGNSAAEIMTAIHAGAAIWATRHAEMNTWYTRRGRYTFRLKYTCDLKALADHEHADDPIIGQQLVMLINGLMGQKPDNLN